MARMMIRVFSAPGFSGVWRAGRKWPVEGVVVETTDGNKDIEATKDEPLRICKATLAALRGDSRFTFDASDSIEEIDEIKRKLAEAAQENGRIVSDAQKLVEENKKLVAENAALKARVAELEKKAATPEPKASKADEPKPKAETAAAAK